MSTEDVWTLIRKAYVFSLPLVMMDNTRIISTNVAEPEEGKAPINQVGDIGLSLLYGCCRPTELLV